MDYKCNNMCIITVVILKGMNDEEATQNIGIRMVGYACVVG
jgi:hypothetical protein